VFLLVPKERLNLPRVCFPLFPVLGIPMQAFMTLVEPALQVELGTRDVRTRSFDALGNDENGSLAAFRHSATLPKPKTRINSEAPSTCQPLVSVAPTGFGDAPPAFGSLSRRRRAASMVIPKAARVRRAG
jgi:hypothetical protein